MTSCLWKRLPFSFYFFFFFKLERSLRGFLWNHTHHFTFLAYFLFKSRVLCLHKVTFFMGGFWMPYKGIIFLFCKCFCNNLTRYPLPIKSLLWRQHSTHGMLQSTLLNSDLLLTFIPTLGKTFFSTSPFCSLFPVCLDAVGTVFLRNEWHWHGLSILSASNILNSDTLKMGG